MKAEMGPEMLRLSLPMEALGWTVNLALERNDPSMARAENDTGSPGQHFQTGSLGTALVTRT